MDSALTSKQSRRHSKDSQRLKSFPIDSMRNGTSDSAMEYQQHTGYDKDPRSCRHPSLAPSTSNLFTSDGIREVANGALDCRYAEPQRCMLVDSQDIQRDGDQHTRLVTWPKATTDNGIQEPETLLSPGDESTPRTPYFDDRTANTASKQPPYDDERQPYQPLERWLAAPPHSDPFSIIKLESSAAENHSSRPK